MVDGRAVMKGPVPHFFRDEGESILNQLRGIDHIACYHRRGVWDCPHCGWGNSDNYDEWLETPWLKEIHLQTRLFKLAHLVIVSRCPKCRLFSWIHYPIDDVLKKRRYFETGLDDTLDPHYDYDLIKKEQDRLWAEAQEEWDNSLCKTCSRAEREPFSGYRGKYSPSVECEVTVTEEDGTTWTIHPGGGRKTECKHYVKEKRT